MHGLGDQFFARAGFAQQQHRGVRLRDLPGEAIHLLHGTAGTDDAFERRSRLWIERRQARIRVSR